MMLKMMILVLTFIPNFIFFNPTEGLLTEKMERQVICQDVVLASLTELLSIPFFLIPNSTSFQDARIEKSPFPAFHS